MKNLIKFIGSAALLVMFSLALSSYDSVQPLDDPGNGTIVEVVKDQQWNLSACGQVVSTTKTTSQYKDGVLHNRTLVFSLPEGHCFIQDKAYKMVISGHDANITPSGMMIVKLVNND